MHTKETEPCLLNTPNDEPIWTLCGRDVLAPQTIRAWAAAANARGVNHEKVQTALKDAEEIAQWQKDHPDRVKLPD